MNVCIFLISCDETCQRLDALYNPVNQYFPNNKCLMLPNRDWIKDPFRVQDGTMDFNVTEYQKFIDSP